MPLTMNDLTISPEGLDRNSFLSDWDWLMTEKMQPILLTAMGDVFAEGKSGIVYYLDMVEGTVHEVTENFEDFKKLLTDSEFVTSFMFPNRIVEYREAGLQLEKNQVYSHKQPLVLGGADELENVVTTDVSVHVSLHGQIHQQIKDLPEGASVEIKID